MSDTTKTGCVSCDAPTIVKHTHYPNGGLVSTAFLMFGYEYPYETMVFEVDGWKDYQERYATKAEALVGHDATVIRINADEAPE